MTATLGAVLLVASGLLFLLGFAVQARRLLVLAIAVVVVGPMVVAALAGMGPMILAGAVVLLGLFAFPRSTSRARTPRREPRVSQKRRLDRE